MNSHVKELTEAARHLTEDEKIELVEGILGTLNPVDVAIERAWAAEANRRYEAYVRGDMGARDAASVIADLRTRRASR